jgi:hypothetical protein
MENLVLDIQFSNENTAEPVTVQEAKNWLKIDVPDDDILLSDIITSARQECENYTCISFIERTVTACLYIGLDEIRLPYGPVKNVLSVTNNTGQPVQSFELKYNVFKALDPCPEVTAKYNAGFVYGALPKNFKQAVLNQVAWQYEHRGDETETQGLSPEALRKLKPHRRVT